MQGEVDFVTAVFLFTLGMVTFYLVLGVLTSIVEHIYELWKKR